MWGNVHVAMLCLCLLMSLCVCVRSTSLQWKRCWFTVFPWRMVGSHLRRKNESTGKIFTHSPPSPGNQIHAVVRYEHTKIQNMNTRVQQCFCFFDRLWAKIQLKKGKTLNWNTRLRRGFSGLAGSGMDKQKEKSWRLGAIMTLWLAISSQTNYCNY